MSAYDHSRVAHFIGELKLVGRVRLYSAHFAGGNSLDKASAGRVKDFVQANGGHTVITKVSTIRSGGKCTSADLLFLGSYRE